jgi:hypothetical protein
VVAVSSSATPAAAPPRCRRARSPPSHTHLPDPNPNHTSFVTAVVGAPLRWEKKVGGGWRAVRRRGRVSLPTARLVDAILLECPSGAVEKHRALPTPVCADFARTVLGVAPVNVRAGTLSHRRPGSPSRPWARGVCLLVGAPVLSPATTATYTALSPEF